MEAKETDRKMEQLYDEWEQLPAKTAGAFFTYVLNAGRKEVVEFVEENFSDNLPKHTNTALMGRRGQRWQARKKIWGIKQ